jgi:hypothetical protein
MQYGNVIFQVPVETLMTENDEIQSIQIGDYATVVSPTDITDHESQVNVYCRKAQVLESCHVCFRPAKEGRFMFVEFYSGPSECRSFLFIFHV